MSTDRSRRRDAFARSGRDADDKWSITTGSLGPADNYKLLTAAVVPRPIAWTSTIGPDGVANLAPFSFFTVVSREPPMLSLTIGSRDGSAASKDTLANVRDNGEFVVNIASGELASELHASAAEFPPGVDEFAAVGVTPAPSTSVRPPRIREAPINIECRVHLIQPMGEQDHLVIGVVERLHIRADLYEPLGRVDHLGLSPIGRLAGTYSSVRDVFVPDPPAATRPGSST